MFGTPPQLPLVGGGPIVTPVPTSDYLGGLSAPPSRDDQRDNPKRRHEAILWGENYGKTKGTSMTVGMFSHDLDHFRGEDGNLGLEPIYNRTVLYSPPVVYGVSFCYHAATRTPRTRSIQEHHHLVQILGFLCG